MGKKSKKQDKKNKDNVVEFHNFSQNKPLDGARLREEYDAEESDDESVSDGIAEYLLNQLFEKNENEYNYNDVLLGLNKAYLQVLLQLVDDSGYDTDEFLEYFYKEADRIAEKYIEDNSYDFDPVKASGSLALAAAYIFGVLDDEDDEED